MKSLEGKVALVTGAGQNIGRSIACRLAELGASVAVNGRSNRSSVDEVVSAIEGAGGRAVAAMGDVSVPEQVAAVVDTCVTELGGVDIVVSNAGLRRQTALVDMTFEEWREVLSVALDGAFLLARHAVPHLIARGGGRIIGISGISTHVGTPERCHVSASKAGLEGLMRALAVELAPHQITCNSVAPGAIDTVRGAAAGAMPPSTGTVSSIPLGRRGSVDDVTAAVVHLAGPGGAYVTGQTLHVNGGMYLT